MEILDEDSPATAEVPPWAYNIDDISIRLDPDLKYHIEFRFWREGKWRRAFQYVDEDNWTNLKEYVVGWANVVTYWRKEEEQSDL
jgi:hypothetical protein